MNIALDRGTVAAGGTSGMASRFCDILWNNELDQFLGGCSLFYEQGAIALSNSGSCYPGSDWQNAVAMNFQLTAM